MRRLGRQQETCFANGRPRQADVGTAPNRPRMSWKGECQFQQPVPIPDMVPAVQRDHRPGQAIPTERSLVQDSS